MGHCSMICLSPPALLPPPGLVGAPSGSLPINPVLVPLINPVLVPHRPHYEAEEASGDSEIPGANCSVLHGHRNPLGGALEADIEPWAGTIARTLPAAQEGFPGSC